MNILMHNYVIKDFFYYYNSVHVSSNAVLIIRRSNCINIASSIVLSVSGNPVCRLQTGRSLTESTIPCCIDTI